MTRQTSEFTEKCRTRARAVKVRLDAMGKPVSLAQAYEVIAAEDGFRTWAAMKATVNMESVSVNTSTAPQADPSIGKTGTWRSKLTQIVEDISSAKGFASYVLVRRTSIDAAAGDGSAFRGAHAELSFFFFDGQEYPAMRFRSMKRLQDDKYSVVVDIKMPEHLEEHEYWPYANDLMKKACKDNIVSWAVAPRPEPMSGYDAYFLGSGKQGTSISK